MELTDRIRIDVHLCARDLIAAMPGEVRRGLTDRPKHLPSKYFYDERGSRLFEEITELPEYYPTRTEAALLDRTAPEIAGLTRPREVLELGSGSAKKTGTLLDAASDAGLDTRLITRLGIPACWIYQGSRAEQLEDAGIDAAAIARTVREVVDRTEPVEVPPVEVPARERTKV